MLQQSKILRSRDGWKAKAVQRADEIRERRKAEIRYKETIAELQKRNEGLIEAIEDQKKTA